MIQVMLSWESMTPLGLLVVPEVYTSTAVWFTAWS